MAFTMQKGSSSSSSSSSSSPYGSTSSPRWTYHAFLSFRGEDTRKGFTDHLFAALQRKGITTFRDDKGLERGQVISEKLLKAIEESMFGITILSPNYASSTWCLEELQKIVECSKNLGLAIIPIFYGVEPSDVRHQRGSFAEAFKKHEENFRHDTKKVESWRDALRQVANYSGWDSKDWHEAALVESIVEHIHKKLIPKLPSCTENLVGIALRVQKVNSLIGMGLNNVRFIGIWGMGGIGKTTIARAVYEGIRNEFKVSCFMANIRELFDINGLVHLQRELLSRLNITSCDFYDLYDGKRTIQNSLCNEKVLLVLDDASEISQLTNLAGKQDWFGPGSRVIITTRDMHLLRIHGVHETYEVEGLDEKEALHLFCLNAFKRDQPAEGYLDLSKEVVEYTGGLPLALEVLGSHLYGRTIDVWHSALEQIRSAPHPKIQDTLQISYKGLNPMEKNIFLDIACFFKGMRKHKLITILKNCGHFPEIGIDVLIERSLITLDQNSNRLGMHDLLQEMGWHIVFQESPNDPGKRSRLWSRKDIDYVLTNNTGTEAIQCISLQQSYDAHWSVEAFSKASQLQILNFADVRLPLGLNYLPCSLKGLYWRGCSLKSLPLTNQPNEVVEICLSYSKIEQPWHGTKFLEKLKYLNLGFSKNLKQLPDFCGVPNLETLILEGCPSLTEVHTSLVCHKKLVLMNLIDCTSLEALPSKLEMSSLKKLILDGCSQFKNLPAFGACMEHLSVLSLWGTAITRLPLSLGCLVGLVDLNLMSCRNLVRLPDTICKLKSLRILKISGCSKLCRLPEGIKELKCLETLWASKTDIEEVPSSIFNLENLRDLLFGGCKGPTSESMNLFLPSGCRLPPSVLNLPYLSTMDLSYHNLSEESFPHDFSHLRSLQYLYLSGNNFVSLPCGISKLAKLEILELNWCRKLQSLPELPSSIRGLDALHCDSLESSKFNPSKLCSIFASPMQSHKEWMHLTEKPPLLKARLEMVIAGGEIPSWFVSQESVSWPKIPIPPHCIRNEWVGIALCFQLVSSADAHMVDYSSIQSFLSICNCSSSFKISYNYLPRLEPNFPHLYFLYLSIDGFRDLIHKNGHWSEFEVKSECEWLIVKRCGYRLVYKQDVEDWNEQSNEEMQQESKIFGGGADNIAGPSQKRRRMM